MTQGNPDSSKFRSLVVRRLMLLASVGAIVGAVVLAGPSGYWQSQLGTPARAADSSMQHPVGFADIVAKVKPAVISVRVKVAAAEEPALFQQNRDDDEQIPVHPRSPLDKFLQQFGDQFGQQFGPNAPRGHETITGEGSGFFISADGYAVTNNHVVDHAKSVQVTTDDGTIYTAKVVGTDAKTDLAVIKIDGRNDFPYVKFADHAPQVGDWVVAVGNPFGLGGTVTAGIVSARGRDIGAGPYDDYVQIDAPINKGNSGGPAFDVGGNVIGVNTAIYSPSGGSVGIGFDIPADTAKLVVAQLKDKGTVTRGWLGVQIQPMTRAIADSLSLKKAEGAMVDEPQNGSPAAKAGIESGDVITAVNGTPVKDARDLARTIGMMAPDSSVRLDIIHKGQPKTVSLALAQMPNDQRASAKTGSDEPTSGVPHLGLQVAPASEVSGAGEKGVVVTAVDPDGPAAEQGILTGNVILEVGGKAVAGADDVRNALREAKSQGKHQVLMRLKMGEATRFVALPLGNA
ncbi:MAG: Do family serine endopeptidase [Xanthobacteraceae bacterium]